MHALQPSPPVAALLPSTRRVLLAAPPCLLLLPAGVSPPPALAAAPPPPAPQRPAFRRAANGLLLLDLAPGSASGAVVAPGSHVSIAYTARLAAKNGWVFAEARPEDDNLLEWVVGDDTSGVLAGLDAAVRGMRVGSVRRAVVPPALGYVDEATRPVPAEFWQRRRLYSTVFNQTRLSNGEGDSLATTVWDIRLVRVSR